MCGSNCCFLTCIQIFHEVDKVVWYSHFFKDFPQFAVIHIVKGFSIVNEAGIDVFLELSCFFNDPTDVGNLISGSSTFSNSSLNIWKFSVHVLLKAGLENFEHYFASVWDECNCAVVWTFFGIPFLWDWNKNWPFQSLCFYKMQLCSKLGAAGLSDETSDINYAWYSIPVYLLSLHMCLKYGPIKGS